MFKGLQLFKRLKQWRDARYMQRHALSDACWQRAQALPALSHLCPHEKELLRTRATLFLRNKLFYGAHGYAVDDWMRTRIATEACLPLLHLEGTHYDDFTSIVLYESSFVVPHQDIDAAGVVHETDHALSGQSWDRGPLVLSWHDVETPAHDGANVVLHEFAHKLDGEDGGVDGRPPLRKGMRGADWHHAFQNAFDDLTARLQHPHSYTYSHAPHQHQHQHQHLHSALDPYAAEAPEEFFAVCMETFFMSPTTLHTQYPKVYEQMAQWLQQDPLIAAQASLQQHPLQPHTVIH